MSKLEATNLIRFFDFYLIVVALLGLFRRYPFYWDLFLLIVRAQGRWPRVVSRLRQHHGLLLTWDVLVPFALAAGLMAIQFIASRLVFPQATIRFYDLLHHPFWFALLLLAALPMLLVDAYFLWQVGRIDRSSAEQYLDQAESWAGTWRA
ncbi:MAG: hypothetical protein ACRCZF_12410, partial [Gemmataceae bacterium]